MTIKKLNKLPTYLHVHYNAIYERNIGSIYLKIPKYSYIKDISNVYIPYIFQYYNNNIISCYLKTRL